MLLQEYQGRHNLGVEMHTQLVTVAILQVEHEVAELAEAWNSQHSRLFVVVIGAGTCNKNIGLSILDLFPETKDFLYKNFFRFIRSVSN